MTNTLEGIRFGAHLELEPFPDPVIDALGHDPRSDYVERFWLPVLGPSTTLLLRLLTDRLDGSTARVRLDIAETARALGLGERQGRHGPFLRSIARAIDFDMVRYLGPGVIGVRRRLPTLSSRHLARLPESLQHEHAHLAQTIDTTTDLMMRRGQQLALSLLTLGESSQEAQRQLARWSFDEALARECTIWAARELARASRGANPRSAHPSQRVGPRTSIGS